MMNTQHDSMPQLTEEELLKVADQAEQEDRKALLKANQRILGDFAELIMQVERQYSIAPEDLVHDKVQGTDLPLQIKQEISRLQAKVKSTIYAVAERIEDRKYRTPEEVIATQDLTMVEKERAKKLIAAEKQINISCQSLQLTISFFKELNNWILTRLTEEERKQNAEMARQLITANAILVYELCDFVICYIENFQIAGVNELLALNAESEQARKRFREELEELKNQARGQGIPKAQSEATLEHARYREAALNRMEEEWKGYIGQIDGVSKGYQTYKAKLPGLYLARSNAKNQIAFIGMVQLHRLITSSLQALEMAITDIDQLEMPHMTAERMDILLGRVTDFGRSK